MNPDQREPGPTGTDVIVSVSAIFVASFVLFALITLIAGLPVPRLHDDFSHLLAADTFARGRLSNPTHPLWPHFETFNTILTPSYQSSHQPAQGMMLAAGRLAGHPILGVWLVSSASIAALFWCLTRWLPMRWAVGGAAISLLHPLVLSWSQSYSGGAVALLGGSLVIGAMQPRPDGRSRAILLVAAIGILILAASRPYEAVVLSVAASIFLLRQRGKILGAIALAAGLAALGMYNRDVTSSPLKTPSMVHQQQYAVVPTFLFQSLRLAPEYRHERLRRFYAEVAVAQYRETTLTKRLNQLARGAFRLFLPAVDGQPSLQEFPAIYLSAVFLIPAIGMLAAMRRDRWITYALLMLLFFLAALMLLTRVAPDNAASAAPLLVIVLTAGLMKAHRIRGLTPLFVLVFLASAASSVWFIRQGQRGPGIWTEALQRQHIQRELSESGASNLVIVRYPPRSPLRFEWVQNEADIDGSGVVWAHEMADNAALVNYFQKREVWLLDVSVVPPQLIRP